MQLMTKEIEEKLKKTGCIPNVDNLIEATVIVKYFYPCGAATWLIVGGEQDGPIWRLFGYVTMNGIDWEWGSVFLHDLQRYKGFMGLGIERDLNCVNKTVKELVIKELT